MSLTSFIFWGSLILMAIVWILARALKPTFYNPKSEKPLILYLREFLSDYTDMELINSTFLPKQSMTHEFNLMGRYGLNIYGQFVSVGDPKTERIGLLDTDGNVEKQFVMSPTKWGSNLIFLQGLDWKEKVTELISKAEMIIIRPGFSEGILWEFNEIHKVDALKKTIIFLQWQIENEQIEAISYNYFKEKLPHLAGFLPPFTRGSKFIYYDDDLKPQCVNSLRDIPLYINIKQKHKQKKEEKRRKIEEERRKAMEIKLPPVPASNEESNERLKK